MNCEICDFKTDNNLKFSGHLRYTHNITTKEYYDNYIMKEGENKCQYCGKPTKFIGLTKGGYRKHCSTRCSSLDPKVKEKVKNTCLLKYGVENPYQAEEIKEKIKQTNIDRFGVDNPLKNKELAAKVGKSCSNTKMKIKNDFYTNHPELITKEDLTNKYGWMWY